MSDQQHQQSIEAAYYDMIDSALTPFTEEEKAPIFRAFQLANEAHKGTRRKSGEPYIMHPIAVAKIAVSEIGLGYKSAMAALLHDVVEDTSYTLDDIRDLFGEQIAYLVGGLTKLNTIFDKNLSLQAENFKKMLLAMSNDVRVVLIKLADRLHNMRTLGSMAPEKREKIASETNYLYAPLAHRFGLYSIKTELEDLTLKYQFPKEYKDLQVKLSSTEEQRQAYIERFKAPIIEKLREQGIEFDISGRVKSMYSIWNKMQKKHIPFEEVYDLFAVRVVFCPTEGVTEKAQCWHIYSLVTDIYQAKQERLRDWISVPKSNGYESLHTTVMGPEGNWVELQIRSTRMDEIAERGYAAHWRYKDNEDNITEVFKEDSVLDKLLFDIRETLSSNEVNPTDFLDQLKLNLFSSEITAFTPKGKMISLPKNATALDFAYSIHTQIGQKAIGAKINHKLTPISQHLHNGDQVEVLTADNQKPQAEWLHFAITPYALNHIKSALKKDEKERMQKGRQVVENAIKEAGWFPNAMLYKRLCNVYDVNNKEELFSNVGAGLMGVQEVERVVKKHLGRSKLLRYWELQLFPHTHKNSTFRGKTKEENIADGVFLLKEKDNVDKLSYKIATCCKPIPGDDVIGFRMGGNNVIVHKKSCPVAVKEASQHGDDIINAKWTEHKKEVFLAAIQLVTIDRSKLLLDIVRVISMDFDANIKNVTSRDHDGLVTTTIELFVHSTNELQNIIKALAKIEGNKNAIRVDIPDN
ncbi:GTP pyrophosphokinase [Bacteroidia bacterium]|nr:GTP pyrophosphokinase [Bacteroidia bacterium]